MKNYLTYFKFILAVTASIDAVTANALIGNSLKSEVSESTCFITDDNGHGFCNGVLISENEVRTASHCYYNIGLHAEGERVQVRCGFSPERGFQFASKISKLVQISKSTIFSDRKFTDDQMILKLDTSAPKPFIANVATSNQIEAFFFKSSNSICKAEAFLTFDKEKPSSAELPLSNVIYDSKNRNINLRYTFDLHTDDDFELLKDAKEDGDAIDSDNATVWLARNLPVPVLTRAGDSGSPLYCRSVLNPASKPLLVGILSRNLNRESAKVNGHIQLTLGSRWNAINFHDQMKSKQIKKIPPPPESILEPLEDIRTLP